MDETKSFEPDDAFDTYCKSLAYEDAYAVLKRTYMTMAEYNFEEWGRWLQDRYLSAYNRVRDLERDMNKDESAARI